MNAEDFYTLLDSVASYSVYPVILPQDSAPALTYVKGDDTRDQHFTGTASLQAAEFDVDCWGSTYATARAEGDTVVSGLNRYSGTVGSTQINNVYLVNDFETYEDQVKLFRVSLSFRVIYQL